MTANQFDLWLTSAGRVYQAVPYEVVSDWLQQGRVLVTDRIRPCGMAEWQKIDDIPTLAVYLPRENVATPTDTVEALQPVELGISIGTRHHDADEDVDMVPLIDISLVLLIFFMMTTTVAVGGANVPLPETRFASLSPGRDSYWVGVDLGPESQPVFSFGEGDRPPAEGDTKLSLEQVVGRVRSRLKNHESSRTSTVRIAAHHRLPIEAVQDLTARLSELKRDGLTEIKAEVAEKSK